jgi:multidrug resistance efflux pump
MHHKNGGLVMKLVKFFTFVLLVLALTACGAGKAAQATPAATQPPVIADSTIVAEARVEPVNYAAVAYNSSGVISDVLVKEGDQVKKGDVLIRLGNESDKAYTTAQLELVTAQQAYDDLLNSSGTEAAQAVIDLKDAKEEYDKADDYLHFLQTSKKVPQTQTKYFLNETWKGWEYTYKSKNFKGPAPEDWVVEATNDLALKKGKLDDAQRTYDRLKDGVDSEQLALLEAKLDAAKAGVASLLVLAPFDGTVAELNSKVGESVSQGSIAATVSDFSNWLVKTTDLTELEVVNIKEGQSASVVLDAIPDVTLNGTVESISQTFAEKQGDVVYEVTVALDDTNPDILWGMTAVVRFEPIQD